MDGWMIAGLAVWFLGTLAAFYVLSFWLNDHLLTLHWLGAVIIMFTLLTVSATADVLLLKDSFDPPDPVFFIAAGHAIILIMVCLGHEMIQAWIGYPYKR